MPRGGARPGSGPKRGTKYGPRAKKEKPAPVAAEATEATAGDLDPLTYMLKVMNDPAADKDRRDKMALFSAPYVHPKAGELGKKEKAKERAERAGSGRFAPARPPARVIPFDQDRNR